MIEHDLQVIASCCGIIDIDPGAGEEGGHIIAAGPPGETASRDALSRCPPVFAFT